MELLRLGDTPTLLSLYEAYDNVGQGGFLLHASGRIDLETLELGTIANGAESYDPSGNSLPFSRLVFGSQSVLLTSVIAASRSGGAQGFGWCTHRSQDGVLRSTFYGSDEDKQTVVDASRNLVPGGAVYPIGPLPWVQHEWRRYEKPGEWVSDHPQRVRRRRLAGVREENAPYSPGLFPGLQLQAKDIAYLIERVVPLHTVAPWPGFHHFGEGPAVCSSGGHVVYGDDGDFFHADDYGNCVGVAARKRMDVVGLGIERINTFHTGAAFSSPGGLEPR